MLHPWAMRMFGQKRKISAKFLWAHAYLPSLEKIVKDRKGVNLLLTLFYSYWSYVWRIVMYCILPYGCTANYGRSHLSIQIKTVHYTAWILDCHKSFQSTELNNGYMMEQLMLLSKFRFVHHYIYRDEDDDAVTGKTDRQRWDKADWPCIKSVVSWRRTISNVVFSRLEMYTGTKTELRAVEGITTIHAWWFRLRTNIVAGNDFFHIYQVCFKGIS